MINCDLFVRESLTTHCVSKTKLGVILYEYKSFLVQTWRISIS